MVSTVSMAIEMVSAINKGITPELENNPERVKVYSDLSFANKLWPRLEKLRQKTTELAQAIFS